MGIYGEKKASRVITKCAWGPGSFHLRDHKGYFHKGGSLLDDVNSDEEAQQPQDESLGRNSVKRSFLRKVFGPITDYGSRYDLVHFMYDLLLWSDIGAKKAELTHMPMRLALKGQPWTPAFWMARHAALLDLQRQCGPPVLFKTWAPYEWATPYHPWVLDMMEKEGRGRLHLAGQTVHLGPSEFSADGKLRLHHTETDFDMGIRAYDAEDKV